MHLTAATTLCNFGCFALLGASIGSLVGYARSAAQLKRFRHRYLRVEGWHAHYGTYDLESFDGGITWYAMGDGKGGGRSVVGPADTVFPGLTAEPGVVLSGGESIYKMNKCAASEAVGQKDAPSRRALWAVPTVKTSRLKAAIEAGRGPSRDRNQALCMCLPALADGDL